MTIAEKMFFNRIEIVRGVIKNKKKFEPIVCDIYSHGSHRWINEAKELKRFGLQFIYEVTTTLSLIHQNELLDNINKLHKPNIRTAKTEFSLIKLKYKY